MADGKIRETDEEIQEFMDEEIARAPQAPEELLERLDEHNSSSPADSGGDIDAAWEEVNSSGSETVFGDNPTPDQSEVEANAHAMGINYDDDEPLDFEGKLEERDEHRFELSEKSKTEDDTI
ncbi:MAG: DUF6335 family protein [Pyrinomonadaceae bacterium]